MSFFEDFGFDGPLLCDGGALHSGGESPCAGPAREADLGRRASVPGRRLALRSPSDEASLTYRPQR
jgi:hypothetical protein